MSSITSHSDPYLTYVLSSEGSQVEIVPERGGILTRWNWQGSEIFYLDQERFKDPALTVRGGIPILFPICGNVPNNQYTLNGQSYSIKQHGFARNLPWQVMAQSQPEAQDPWLTVQLKSSDQTLESYPFHFEVQFTYHLSGSRLLLRQTYTNLNTQVMPLMTGLHPYFAVSNKAQLQVGIPAGQLFDHLTQKTQVFEGHFDFEADEIDVALAPLSEQRATVTDPERQYKLTLSFSEQYSTVVFWTVKGKDFYCLEPWSGPRMSLITGDHLLHIPPGEDLVTEVSFSLAPA